MADTFYTDAEYQQFVAVHGPFRPPPDYLIEEELLGPAPRPLPEWVWWSPYYHRINALTSGCIIGGLLVVASKWLPSYPRVEEHFVFFWICWLMGWGAIAIGVGNALLRAWRPGGFRYIREGRPLVGRLMRLRTVTHMMHAGHVPVPMLRLAAAIEVIQDGQLMWHEFQVGQMGSFIDAVDAWKVSRKPGEYLTLVDIPGKKDSLRIYEELCLRPNERFAVYGEDSPEPNLVNAAVAASIFGVFYLAAIEMVHTAVFCWPLNPPRLLIAGAVLAGTVCFFGCIIGGIWIRRKRQQGNLALSSALVCGLFGIPLGILFLPLWLNAKFDRSAPEYRPAVLRQIKHNAAHHLDIFGKQRAVWHFASDNRRRTMVIPEEAGKFHFGTLGLVAAEIRPGAFGWPWVGALHAVKAADPAQIPDAPADALWTGGKLLAAEVGGRLVPLAGPEAAALAESLSKGK